MIPFNKRLTTQGLRGGAQTSLATARFFPSATLLESGSVLVAGGVITFSIPVVPTSLSTTTSAELYQPTSIVPPGVNTISVAPTNQSIAIGAALHFTATTDKSLTLNAVAWSASPAGIVTISNDPTNIGTAYAIGVGQVTISACLPGAVPLCGSTTLTVQPPANPSFTELVPSAGGRCCMGMVFVPEDASGNTNYTLVFGGNSPTINNGLSDTWIFSSGTWSQPQLSVSPDGRSGPGMAYDPATKTVVMFGGVGQNGDLNDTWIWDGASWRQVIANGDASSPLPRRWDTQGMTYDPVNKQVLLFGGVTNGGQTYNDTWLWDGGGQSWTQQFPPDFPTARRAPLVYDPGTNNVVLFGGENGYGPPTLNDTWTWNGSDWIQMSPVTTPPARSMASMAYDNSLGQLILFGGSQAGSGNPDYNDAWAWNGINWTQLNLTGNPAPQRYAFGMVYDPSKGILMYGGLYNQDSVVLTDFWQLSP